MPNQIIKSFSKKSGKTETEVEKIWTDLKTEYGDNYEKITGALKKILKINENKFTTFREFMTEERSSNEYGLKTSGHIMDVDIIMSKSGLMQIDISGKRTLAKLKSVDKLKKEYQESDWKEIEKIWKQLSEEKSIKVEKLLQKFEDDLNKIVIEMEREIENI